MGGSAPTLHKIWEVTCWFGGNPPIPHSNSRYNLAYQTYNSLPLCQEIDISSHKLNQNDYFESKYPSLVTTILKLFPEPCDSDFLADPDSGPGPAIQLGLPGLGLHLFNMYRNISLNLQATRLVL